MKKNLISAQLETEVDGARCSLIMRCPECERFSTRARVISFKDYSVFNALKAGLYERSMQRALRKLKRCFNLCSVCGRWVCDDCFICSNESESVSICVDCAKKSKISGISTGEKQEKERGGKKNEMQ